MKKPIKITSVGDIKNELRKYKAGKKLDINQFNQVARLAWLGKIVLQPLDPSDPECKSWLLYADYPEAMPEHVLDTDQDLIGQIHILDALQGQALAKVFEQGMKERQSLYLDLKLRDFYFDYFYEGDDAGDET
ncbi:MAG: hypothetical protein OEW58_06130 [Gammaproteobacteria bacterium]|nr:hypothetical protein [Gammaproteobacteria bacterium]